jgi:hypothetical protein
VLSDTDRVRTTAPSGAVVPPVTRPEAIIGVAARVTTTQSSWFTATSRSVLCVNAVPAAGLQVIVLGLGPTELGLAVGGIGKSSTGHNRV